MSKESKKKTKRTGLKELIAARNPMDRLAVKPVDLYAPRPPEPAGVPSQQPETPARADVRAMGGKAQREEAMPSAEASTTSASSVPAASSARAGSEDREDPLVPYSTYLRSSHRKAIRLRAVMTGRDAYEIVQEAIDEYIERHPIGL
jgi:hypothetical protein